MEFEKRNTKNPPPEEGSKNLPVTVLAILIGVIVLLLFVGWQYLTDTPSNAEEMVPTQPETVAQQMEDAATDSDIAVVESADDDAENSGLPPLELPQPEKTATANKPEVAEATATKETTKPIAAPAGDKVYTHTVAAGETFYSIASRYNVSVETLKSYNPDVKPENVKVGVTRLKIPVQAIHTVGPGDILRVVSQKYDVPVNLIMKANGKTRNNAQRGEELVIPYSTKK